MNHGQEEKTRKGSPAAPNMRGIKSGSLLDQSFRFSITLKGLHALLEMILGIAILAVNPQAMNRFVVTLLHPSGYST